MSREAFQGSSAHLDSRQRGAMVQSKQSHKPETSTTQTISRIVAASFDAFNNQANASFNAAGGVGLLGVGPGGINFGGIGTHDVNACKIIVDSIDTTFHVIQYYHPPLQWHSPPRHLRRHLPPHPFCTHPPVRKRMGRFVFSCICS